MPSSRSSLVGTEREDVSTCSPSTKSRAAKTPQPVVLGAKNISHPCHGSNGTISSPSARTPHRKKASDTTRTLGVHRRTMWETSIVGTWSLWLMIGRSIKPFEFSNNHSNPRPVPLRYRYPYKTTHAMHASERKSQSVPPTPRLRTY
jgi:hypothetical protein